MSCKWTFRPIRAIFPSSAFFSLSLSLSLSLFLFSLPCPVLLCLFPLTSIQTFFNPEASPPVSTVMTVIEGLEGHKWKDKMVEFSGFETWTLPSAVVGELGRPMATNASIATWGLDSSSRSPATAYPCKVGKPSNLSTVGNPAASKWMVLAVEVV
ncbi:hypothetical protein GGR55DRAFT_127118 [Xylaria sp. FL0064]|nr:hypothetical protein GGR55DRAFT_127118 [Xylaria sp. FL0064]